MDQSRPKRTKRHNLPTVPALGFESSERISVAVPAPIDHPVPPWVDVHVQPDLDPELDVVTIDGMRVTRLERTIIDCAGDLHVDMVIDMLHRGEREHGIDVERFEQTLERIEDPTSRRVAGLALERWQWELEEAKSYPRLDERKIELARELMEDMLETAFSDCVEMAEVGASTACMGWYVGVLLGDEQATRAEHSAAVGPALRIIDEYGVHTGITPNHRAICAAALARLAPDVRSIELSQRITDAATLAPGARDIQWPAWRKMALVTPLRAWIERKPLAEPPALMISWRDSSGREHTTVMVGYGEFMPRRSVGRAVESLLLGDTAREMRRELRPARGVPGYTFDEIPLHAARTYLTDMIDDVRIAAEHLPPADVSFGHLAFLEHRRDLLPDQ